MPSFPLAQVLVSADHQAIEDPAQILGFFS